MRVGILDEDSLPDLLKQQERALPLASMAYVLGYAGEASLVRALARQAGLPGVVFEGTKIDLSLIDAFDPDWLSENMILPVHREERRFYLAVANPRAMAKISRQIEFDHNVSLVIHASLHVVLARAIRNSAAARARGQSYLIGAGAKPTQVGPLSPKHHFALANLLQKKRGPLCITRRAIRPRRWTRGGVPCPTCPDPVWRANIEHFMRKLIAKMQSEA